MMIREKRYKYLILILMKEEIEEEYNYLIFKECI